MDVNFIDWFNVNNKSLFGIGVGNISNLLFHYVFHKSGRLVRLIRGKKCRTTQHFMDEIGAALQFPAYFGENWYALEDCLTMLYECRPLCEILLVIDGFSQFLVEEDNEQIEAFIITFIHARNFWKREINDEYDDWDNHLKTPFKCLLIQHDDECTRNLNRFKDILKNLEQENNEIEQVFTTFAEEDIQNSSDDN